jgi:asparagine synthase (glutamine-hydrolysing)
MCGIFAVFGKPRQTSGDRIRYTKQALLSQHRGPDETHAIYRDNYCMIFNRLVVNGLTPESSQPMVHPADANLILICNGEIYNHKLLSRNYELPYHSKSDCESILHLYKHFGGTPEAFQLAVNHLDGVFAICLLDLNNNTVHLARDPYGVRSMYYYHRENSLIVASEVKSIVDPLSYAWGFDVGFVKEYPSGVTMSFHYPSMELIVEYQYACYHFPETRNTACIDEISYRIRELLEASVCKRLMCDRTMNDGLPAVGAFLSGGLDSSIVAALVQLNYSGRLHTFSIGMKGAPDLEFARIVAEYIKSDHTEYIVTREELLEVISCVVEQVETYDVTTIRASAPMLLLSKKVKRDFPNIIVIYSGEGSDEASGSYLYFRNAPSVREFKAERVRLLRELQFFDNKRCCKSTAYAGLEARVPFLDRDFISYYMSIDSNLMIPSRWGGVEKYLLRLSAKLDHTKTGRPLLPDSITDRTKEAFSDGVSTESSSWHKIIQDHVKSLPVDNEKEWYLSLFNKYYPGLTHLIPHYWMPRWSTTDDPSARTLSLYNNHLKETTIDE